MVATKFLTFLSGCWLLGWCVSLVQAEPLRLPLDQRPDWIQDGIVMAGSWEPLIFRVRRDGSEGDTPTLEQAAAYRYEQSPEMVARLKDLGVNFVMMHCYKGAGLETERESMADAVRFTKVCHDADVRVGVYNYSGAFLWKPFFEENPEARDWVVLDEKGQPQCYGSRAKYRYYWNRNHPEARAFYRNLVRFAIEDVQADLIHLDNHRVGPGRDRHSVQRFRNYLRETFSAAQLTQMGVSDIDTVQPAMTGQPDNLLRRAWLEFASQSVADAYHDMSRYARTLRPDILFECNTLGQPTRIRAPVDHGRIYQGGEAFWNESSPSGYHNGRLRHRIATYKIARRMDNMVFAYTTTPLEMAESMAFNRDCLGCICWFEYGKLVARPGSTDPVSPKLAPFIRFFKTRRDLFRDADVVADVAVLRSFPSQVFAAPKYWQVTSAVEQELISGRVPFQIIYDHHLSDLQRYRVLLLAGCPALSDAQAALIKHYVASGGRVCVIGPVATHNEWMIPRKKHALDDLPVHAVVTQTEQETYLDAIRRACNGKLSLSIEAPAGLCAELTTQPGQRLVHLVNYLPDKPIANVAVALRLPNGYQVKNIRLASPERPSDIELAVKQKNDVATFTVPAILVYEIAVVNYD